MTDAETRAQDYLLNNEGSAVDKLTGFAKETVRELVEKIQQGFSIDDAFREMFQEDL